METARAILRLLKKHNEYLEGFPIEQQAARWEELIAKAFSHTLNIPFYSRDNDRKSVRFRVSWQGSGRPPSIAPSGTPDIVAYCYDFDLLVEPTLKTGANQWTQEYASSLRHCEDYITAKGLDPSNVYVIVVPLELHRDTYRSIRDRPRGSITFVPMEVTHLAKILQTSILASTMRHSELRRLLYKLQESIRTSSSLPNYHTSIDNLLTDWQKRVFGRGVLGFIGVKSCRIMWKLIKESDRRWISTSEIFEELVRDRFVTQYLRITGRGLDFATINESLLQGGFAIDITTEQETEETFFQPLPHEDVKRGGLLRVRKELEKINEKYR